MAETFHLSLVTPEREVLDVDVRFVAFPAHDGEIGILPRRAPLLVKVGIGTLRAETAEGRRELFVDGGFAQMVEDRLTILTEQALAPDEIDPDAARQALEEAMRRGPLDERSYRERRAAIERARKQLRLASG